MYGLFARLLNSSEAFRELSLSASPALLLGRLSIMDSILERRFVAPGVVRSAGPLVRCVERSGDVGTVARPLAPYGILEAVLQLGVAERLGNDVIGSSWYRRQYCAVFWGCSVKEVHGRGRGQRHPNLELLGASRPIGLRTRRHCA